MAEGMKSEEEKAAEARRGPPVQRRGPGAGIGAPVEKPQQFLPSAKRVLGLLRPDRTLLVVVLALGAVSVMLSALGPLILARATDLIFAGVFSRRLASGTTQERAVQDLREQGRDTVADILGAMDYVVPGKGIDFGAIAEVLALVLASTWWPRCCPRYGVGVCQVAG